MKKKKEINFERNQFGGNLKLENRTVIPNNEKEVQLALKRC